MVIVMTCIISSLVPPGNMVVGNISKGPITLPETYSKHVNAKHEAQS